MNTELSLLFGLLPLIIFVIIDSFFSLKAGLIAAIILSLLECIYTIYVFGEIDWISITLFLVIAFFAIISWKKDSDLAFKTSPFFVGLVLSSILLITTFLDKPLMVELFAKYQSMFPEQLAPATAFYNSAKGKLLLSNTNWVLGIAILLNSLLVLWAAFRLSNWWWLAIRGVGFYAFSIAAMIIAKLISF